MSYFFRLINLKAIRKEHNKTQEQVADGLNVPLATYRAWEQLRNMPRSIELNKLANYFHCSIDDFIRKPDLPKGAIRVVPGATITIPLHGTIAAGDSIEMLPTNDTIEVLATLAERWPNIFALTVQGESMNRVLPNYSYAIISPTNEVISGKVYALNVNGYDATIKRVEQLNNGFRLLPDSIDPTFTPQTYDFNNPDTENVRIIGRVVHYVMPLDFEY